MKLKAFLNAMPFFVISLIFFFSQQVNPDLYATSTDPVLYFKMCITGFVFMIMGIAVYLITNDSIKRDQEETKNAEREI